ncbi:MAG: MBL fold metallo-hydrolase [Proteobacteria bacterium]|nr:MBL fold metallo-hydrolase [Pseudomonadota bacterium]
MRPAVLAFLATILFGLSSVATDTGGEARICHIANAGFWITNGGKSVLVDALLAEGLEGYARPSKNLERAMEKGLAPFENVALVIASHYHGDHFNAAATLRHMAANPDAHYVLPPQAFELLEKEGLKDSDRQRITHHMPPRSGAYSYQVAGISFRTYYIDHGAGRPVENIGVYIELAGQSFFHPGDMFTDAEALEKAGLDGLEVDYLMAPFWSLMGDQQQVALEAGFEAGHIIPMHLPLKDQPWMKDYGGFDGLMKRVHEALPGTLRLTSEMACVKF